MDVIMVGGVPGAGKTTALRELERTDRVRVLDPETIRDWFQQSFPTLPYRRYRWLVHLVHTVRVLAAVLEGPGDHRPLLIHDPATRLRRRAWFARFARRHGWRPSLVLIDVSRGCAQQGQLRRGRVVDPICFDAHWQRWQSLRPAHEDQPDRDRWHRVVVVDRDRALQALRRAAGCGASPDSGATATHHSMQVA